jgi:propanediol dehydratase small subunit
MEVKYMKNLNKRAKFDIGLKPQALNNTNATGRYFGLQMFRKAIFWLLGGAMAATKTTKIELLQAKDADGTDAKAIEGADATITANIAVTEATLTCATVLATQAVTINGLTFTAAAAADLPNRVFAVGADDTACAASLVLAINHETAGVPGVIASSALGVVTLKAANPGDATITIADPAATITAATIEAQAYVEVDVGSLDLADGFEYVAAKVTTTATSVVAVNVVRGDDRFEPVQQVGAATSI